MRKTYQIHIDGKNRDRVLDAIKHDIRKYLARERRRPVPEGAQFWDFDCRFGLTQDSAALAPLIDIKPRLDAAASAGASSVYVEILARPAVRAPRPAQAEAPPSTGGDAPVQAQDAASLASPAASS